jgi:light-harvesting complex I chlorophyll a/b binding protein 1
MRGGTQGRNPEHLAKFREAELIHARWAMLGVAGMLAVEVLGYGNWLDAPVGVRSRPRCHAR